MILFHRFTPFVILALAGIGFAMLIVNPFGLWVPAVLCFLAIPFLFGRLLLWEFRRPAFWIFLGTPCFLLIAALMFFLLLESETGSWILATVVTLLLGLYAENVFAFYHLPSNYQAYALEFLSLVCYVLSSFFFTGSAYMGQMFLELPFWIPALVVFFIVLGATSAVFWVSKIGFETGLLFAVPGSLIMTEVYIALALLPTSFVTNAAAFAVLWYLYLGVARAHVLEDLERGVLRRYAITGALLLLVIFGTARWL